MVWELITSQSLCWLKKTYTGVWMVWMGWYVYMYIATLNAFPSKGVNKYYGSYFYFTLFFEIETDGEGRGGMK